MVDGGICLDHVEGGSVHIDGPVHTGYHAAAHGKGQLAQGVANSQHMISHIQPFAVTQGHCLKVRGLHLDNRDIIVLVAADISGIILVAVVHRDLHGLCIFHHMIVGDDITICCEDKSGAGRSGLYWLAEKVITAGTSDVNRHHAVDIGRVNLGVRHFSLSVYSFQRYLADGSVADLDRGLAGCPTYSPHNASAQCAAQ